VAEVGADGAVLVDDYAARGSGLQVAYGVLERGYQPDAGVASAVDLARAAVGAAAERDTATGNGVAVASVTADGVEVTVDRTSAAAADHGSAGASAGSDGSGGSSAGGGR
jgi:proteasome beta subunit